MRIKLRVGALMREKGINEAQLAERADVARNTVRALSRDVNTRVDLLVLEKIARALGVGPLALFEETEQERGNGQPAALGFAT